jgi:hypothetical protein
MQLHNNLPPGLSTNHKRLFQLKAVCVNQNAYKTTHKQNMTSYRIIHALYRRFIKLVPAQNMVQLF